MSGKTLSGVEE